MKKTVPVRGITIVEMLAVIGVIAVLLGILLPALSIARKTALWGTSQANMRQIGQLLVLYAGENREAVCPTVFDYSASPAKGKVRSASPDGAVPPIGPLHAGTWADILWTTGKFGPIASATTTSNWDYRFDSPDAALYGSGWDGSSPFRSAETMTTLYGDGSGASPYGSGPFNGGSGSPVDSSGDPITELGQPGYFGGNPFFDARPPTSSRPYSGRFFTTGQIKRPEASMYLMDSNLGEVLGINDATVNPNNPDLDLFGVDWRYSGGYTNVLFLDGHVDSVAKWDNLRELDKDLGVRVWALDEKSFFAN